MTDDKDFNKYEDSVIDIDKFLQTDINITPAFYIHNAILKAQEALSDADFKQGSLKFRFFIENIETLSRAADKIPEDYDIKIKEYEKNLKTEDANVWHVKVANYKLQLLLQNVFNSQTTTEPMKF